MLALERRNLILEQLQEHKRVVVSELSQLYQVSEETIRRDLDKLDRDGLAIKSYGGAIINENTGIDMPFNVRKKHNVPGKKKIAELVAKRIHDGDYIMLDASTTAVFIAKAIKKKERLTVITNSIEVVIELSDVSDWNIISSGGVLKEGYLALGGPLAVQGLQTYHVTKSIFSCKGLDKAQGFTDSQDLFAEIKRAMISSSKERILAVDSSKFDSISFCKAGNFQDIDVIVTDKKPEREWLELFKEYDIECLYFEE